MGDNFQPLNDYRKLPQGEMKQRAVQFCQEMRRRRSVRDFSDQAVDRSIIEACLRAAASAPSGANQQPWRFVVVADPEVKRQIRKASEKVEQEFYTRQATAKWRDALKDLGTVPSKPFLETAPYLIAIFAQQYGLDANGHKKKHYYVSESVGIAVGMLITALHHAGLACLTYTPANMKFLNRILARPSNEKPFMILVVGYPSPNARMPVISKKALEDVAVFV